MANKDRAVSRKVVAEDYLGVDGRTQVNNEDLPDFLVQCRTQYATSMIIISEKRGTFKHHLALLNDLELIFVNGKKNDQINNHLLRQITTYNVFRFF